MNTRHRAPLFGVSWQAVAGRTVARRTIAGRAVIAVFFAAGLLVSATASAQTDPQQKAAAEALFDEGRQLMAQGQYESACRKFQQSQEIDRGVGTLLYLGECYERSSKLASAWAIFREAASAARAAGQGDRARIADERARKLSPSLSKLALLVPQESRIPGFEVLLDDRPLSSALFGVPFPVDAGTHELTARAPGRAPWSSVIEIKGDGDYRSVQIPPLAGAAFESTPASAPPTANGGPSPATPTGTDTAGSASWSGQRLTGVIVAGAGVVALGVGVAFGVKAQGDDDDAVESGCSSTCDNRAAADLNESARSSALLANIGYGVGIAALATGAILFFTAEPSSGDIAAGSHELRIQPHLGLNQGALVVSGGF